VALLLRGRRARSTVNRRTAETSSVVIHPKTRYARNGDVSIAYQVIGDGPLDLLFTPAFVSHLDLYWSAPETTSFFRRLASFSRLILFDKRGTGLSDPVASVATLEERMQDLRAVLDAVGSQQAALFGLSEGGPMSLLFAATHPERTTALIMFGSFARFKPGPDYLWELHEFYDERRALWTDALENHWGEGRALGLFMPSIAGNENIRRMLGTFERAAASPAMVRALDQFNTEIDVTHLLPTIDVPTLVLHRADDIVPSDYGRYLAERIPGARFVELEGSDHLPWLGNADVVVDEVERFLTGARHAAEPDRALATVLFTDIAGSTERAARLGDDRWRALLDSHNELVRRQLVAFGGREVKMLGDGFLATFDGPARAIHCARAIHEDVGSLGIDLRMGVHTGECELIGADVRGIAVHIGARVAARAAPGEVLVSGAVRDLVVGSGIEFTDRGIHELKGVPGEWRLLAVAGARANGEATVAPKDAGGNPLAPNATLVTKGDRTALRVARRAPGVARLMSLALTRKARRRATRE
jgi:pimeloyl-ACP methyl ester carboxylesterase